MTRLNTDNLAAFLSVETPAADSPVGRSEPEARPFDAFLQRAGRSPDAGAENAATANQSGPIDAQSDSIEQDLQNPTEPEHKPEENRDTADSTADVDADADAPNATPQSDELDDDHTPPDDKADEQMAAASDERSDENTEGKKRAEVAINLTEIASAGDGQETRDEADSAAEEAPYRDALSAMENRREDSQSESDAAKQTTTSGRSEQADQAPLEPEAATEEKQPANPTEQSGEREPGGTSEESPKPVEAGGEVETEPPDKPKENAPSQTRIDNPLGPAVSTQEQRRSSTESPRRNERQGSTRAAAENTETPAADRPFGPVAKMLTGQEMAPVAEQVSAEEAKPEPQEKTAKPALTADLKTTSDTQPKGWSPEGLRSSTAPSTSDGTQTDQVDRVRFVQRVARAFEALGEGNGSVRLRLKPPELGGLRLEVNIRDGKMTARIETETSAARTLLLDNLPALRERLAQQDIKIDRFDVDLADRQPDGSPQRSDDDRQPRHRADQQEAPATESHDNDTADVGSARAVTRIGEGGRLDVVI